MPTMDAGHFSPTFRPLLRELSPCLAQRNGHIVSHLQLVTGHAAIAQELYSGKLKKILQSPNYCVASTIGQFDAHAFIGQEI